MAVLSTQFSNLYKRSSAEDERRENGLILNTGEEKMIKRIGKVDKGGNRFCGRISFALVTHKRHRGYRQMRTMRAAK